MPIIKHYSEECSNTEHRFISSQVTFAGIDCTVNQATCETFEVSGYVWMIILLWSNKFAAMESHPWSLTGINSTVYQVMYETFKASGKMAVPVS